MYVASVHSPLKASVCLVEISSSNGDEISQPGSPAATELDATSSASPVPSAAASTSSRSSAPAGIRTNGDDGTSLHECFAGAASANPSFDVASSGEEAETQLRKNNTDSANGNWLSLLASARAARVEASTALSACDNARAAGHLREAPKSSAPRKRQRRDAAGFSAHERLDNGQDGIQNKKLDSQANGVAEKQAEAKAASPASIAIPRACAVRVTEQLPAPKGRPRAPRRPARRSRTLQGKPVPGFAFAAAAQAAIRPAETLPVAAVPCSRDVDVFMTVAGRSCKGGSSTVRIPVADMETSAPVSLVCNALPAAFADHLLRCFLQEGKNWHKGKRWLYDKEIESHRLEAGFHFDRDGRGFSPRWEAAGFGDDLRHLRALIAATVREARAELRQQLRAARGDEKVPLGQDALAQETVALASSGQRLDASSAQWFMAYAQEFAQGNWRWEPSYCVCNLYRDENDFLGAHSDPVDSIGPWSIVASLTLGAARMFRVKPVGAVRSSGKEGGRVTSYSVRLPHNSILVMWEGFQEFWRHEVPKDSGLARHHISGSSRLNFTFRKYVNSVSRRRPTCLCGRKANLKPVLKETSRNKGRYFWSCTNPRAKTGVYHTCDFFKWDDELVAEERRGLASAREGPSAKQTTAGAAAGTCLGQSAIPR